MAEHVATVYADVRPDARGFVEDFRRQVLAGSDTVGREVGQRVGAGIKAEAGNAAAGFVRDFRAKVAAELRNLGAVKVGADTTRARAEVDAFRATVARDKTDVKVGVDKSGMAEAQQQAHLLRDAILLIGPAAVPAGAVAAGAFLGIVPAVAAVMLGIKGIQNEAKQGLLPPEAQQSITTLKSNLSELQTTAATGLLPGIEQATTAAQPAIQALNQDLAGVSTEIGGIIGQAGPALAQILHEIAPLFQSIAGYVKTGADELVHFAQSGTGVQSFMAYVQAELPTVAHTIGELVVFVSHLAQALAPMGHVVLEVFGGLADALAAVPVPVLTALTSGALSAYAAFRTFQGVTAIVTRVSTALEALSKAQARHAAATAASTAEAQAASLQFRASMAEEAAAVTAAKAEEAASVAAAASEEAAAVRAAAASMAESSGSIASLFAADGEAATVAAAEMSSAFAGMDSMFQVQVTVAETSAAQVAASLQAEADAAAAAAAEIAAVATEAAAASEAAAATAAELGAASSIGFAGLLGPLAAVGVGVGLLTMLFHGNRDAAQADQKAIDSYNGSLQQSTDLLAKVNINATAKNLQDQGAVDILHRLHDANVLTSTSFADLATKVNGQQAPFDSLITTLRKVAEAHKDTYTAADRSGQSFGSAVTHYDATGQAAVNLAAKLQALRGELTQQQKAQLALEQAERLAQQQADGGANAASAQARSLGVTRDAYLTAQTAAQKNTAQTEQQTLAFQLENDAASLLQQTLDRLAGKNASVMSAQTALYQAQNAVRDAFKKTGTAIRGSSDAAVAHQQALQGDYQAAVQLAEAVGKQTGSSRAEKQSLLASRDALEAKLRAHQKLTPAVQAYINKLFDLKDLKVPPTKLDIDHRPADKKITELQGEIDRVKQGKVPGLNADSKLGRQVIKDLQDKIAALKQQHPPTVTVNSLAAERIIAASQLKIDALKQHKVPNVAINQDLLNAQIADTQRRLDNLHTRPLNVPIDFYYPNGLPHPQGQPILTRAAGGPITGPGTGTSDSILARVSNGEFVVNAQQTAKHRELLDAINSGVQGFASGGLVGTARQIYDWARSWGATPAGAAGVVGNSKVESNNNPGAYNSAEGAINVFQFEGSRRTALEAYAARHGLSPRSLAAGLGYALTELNGPLGNVKHALQHSSDPARAAATWDALFERSSGSSRSARQSYAREYFGASRSVTGSTGASSAAGSVSAAVSNAAQARGQVGGAIGGFLGSVEKTPSEVASAAKALSDLAKQAGASTRTLSAFAGEQRRLTADSRNLQALNNRIGRARQYESNLWGQYGTEKGNVIGAVTGTFNASSSGQVYTDRPATARSILAADDRAVAQAREWQQGIVKLEQRGFPRAYVMDLWNSGPSSLGQVRALLAMNTATLRGFQRDAAAMAGIANRAGIDAGWEQYGQQITTGDALINGTRNKALAGPVAALANQMFGAGSAAGIGLAHGLLGEAEDAGKRHEAPRRHHGRADQERPQDQVTVAGYGRSRPAHRQRHDAGDARADRRAQSRGVNRRPGRRARRRSPHRYARPAGVPRRARQKLFA
jgi:hypothetical protein